ncbi:hypothetical protein O0544_18285 [Edwardsiella anguillarum]|nr:hypothetical protein [Edwardsiella anguillarum]
MNQRRYITQRIIDACLREDVAGVLSRSTLRREGDAYWLYASHFAVPLRLAVCPTTTCSPGAPPRRAGRSITTTDGTTARATMPGWRA